VVFLNALVVTNHLEEMILALAAGKLSCIQETTEWQRRSLTPETLFRRHIGLARSAEKNPSEFSRSAATVIQDGAEIAGTW
jgi:hypothetical protein